MADLLHQLTIALRGRVAFVGIGNLALGDDGFGLSLLERLAGERFGPESNPHFIPAGTQPEEVVVRLAEAELDNVLFLDAVDFGGEPGGVTFLNSAEICARFPQISTHKISLGALAQMLELNGFTKAWLLGVHPLSTASAAGLSPKVQASVDVLAELLRQLQTTKAKVAA